MVEPRRTDHCDVGEYSRRGYERCSDSEVLSRGTGESLNQRADGSNVLGLLLRSAALKLHGVDHGLSCIAQGRGYLARNYLLIRVQLVLKDFEL
jgi:hypothetical protein